MTKEELIDALNRDLASELAAIAQYTVYAAKATGPYRPQLTTFFGSEIADEQGHAQFLANKIVALGGEPTTKADDVPSPADNRGMLEAVLEAETRAIQSYSERARQAEDFGDKALSIQLEDMVRDETDHAEETQKMLRNWPA